jgi:hypothetical protein
MGRHSGSGSTQAGAATAAVATGAAEALRNGERRTANGGSYRCAHPARASGGPRISRSRDGRLSGCRLENPGLLSGCRLENPGLLLRSAQQTHLTQRRLN